jgi:hypothetical protein
MLIKMRRIRRESGERAINQTDLMFLEDWLKSFCTRADAFNKCRYALILLWKYAKASRRSTRRRLRGCKWPWSNRS